MNTLFQNNEQWFAATLKSMGEAVIATDNVGAIAFMNPVAETLTGWVQAEALGKNILFLSEDEDAEAEEARETTEQANQAIVKLAEKRQKAIKKIQELLMVLKEQ